MKQAGSCKTLLFVLAGCKKGGKRLGGWDNMCAENPRRKSRYSRLDVRGKRRIDSRPFVSAFCLWLIKRIQDPGFPVRSFVSLQRQTDRQLDFACLLA